MNYHKPKEKELTYIYRLCCRILAAEEYGIVYGNVTLIAQEILSGKSIPNPRYIRHIEDEALEVYRRACASGLENEIRELSEKIKQSIPLKKIKTQKCCGNCNTYNEDKFGGYCIWLKQRVNAESKGCAKFEIKI